MKKIVLSLCAISLFSNAQNINLKHDWKEVNRDGVIQYISNEKTPFPFSETGEPQAVMNFGASISNGESLNEIISKEIEQIQEEYIIADYLEGDYEPTNNMVSFYRRIDNHKVGIIKYRVSGFKGGISFLPRSIRHLLFIKDEKLWISTLIVLYAEDQYNLREDQINYIKAILAK